MVGFTLSGGGATYGVYVGNVKASHVGWIDRENGFFIDPTVVKEFVRISPADLRAIADRVEEVRTYGY